MELLPELVINKNFEETFVIFVSNKSLQQIYDMKWSQKYFASKITS